MTDETSTPSPDTGESEPVLAAGCVLWRRPDSPPGRPTDGLTADAPNGATPSRAGSPSAAGRPPLPDSLAICLVHRPKYDES